MPHTTIFFFTIATAASPTATGVRQAIGADTKIMLRYTYILAPRYFDLQAEETFTSRFRDAMTSPTPTEAARRRGLMTISKPRCKKSLIDDTRRVNTTTRDGEVDADIALLSPAGRAMSIHLRLR